MPKKNVSKRFMIKLDPHTKIQGNSFVERIYHPKSLKHPTFFICLRFEGPVAFGSQKLSLETQGLFKVLEPNGSSQWNPEIKSLNFIFPTKYM